VLNSEHGPLQTLLTTTYEYAINHFVYSKLHNLLNKDAWYSPSKRRILSFYRLGLYTHFISFLFTLCRRTKRALRRVYESKREKVGEGWRRLRNVELHKLNASPNFSTVIELKRMRWSGRVVRMGEMSVYRILVGNLKERNHSEDPAVDGRCYWNRS
jgi:hypothetical protein